MIDELGKDAVDRARRDACQIGKLGSGEALAACIAAGVVKVGDDPHADAGFLGQVEELLIDGMFLLFLRGLPVFGHGDAGEEFLPDDIGAVSAGG